MLVYFYDFIFDKYLNHNYFFSIFVHKGPWQLSVIFCVFFFLFAPDNWFWIKAQGDIWVLRFGNFLKKSITFGMLSILSTFPGNVGTVLCYFSLFQQKNAHMSSVKKRLLNIPHQNCWGGRFFFLPFFVSIFLRWFWLLKNLDPIWWTGVKF